MDNISFWIPELLKITLPSLIVAVSLYLLVRQYLDKEYKRRLLELRMKNTKTILPVRLQAYERLCLFLERITPSNLLIRVSGAGQNASDYHRLLLNEIRNEYNHNVSQQMYTSEQGWFMVKKSKEDVVTLINQAYHELEDKSRGTDLAKRVLERIIEHEIDPTERSISFLKQELNQVF